MFATKLPFFNLLPAHNQDNLARGKAGIPNRQATRGARRGAGWNSLEPGNSPPLCKVGDELKQYAGEPRATERTRFRGEAERRSFCTRPSPRTPSHRPRRKARTLLRPIFISVSLRETDRQRHSDRWIFARAKK